MSTIVCATKRVDLDPVTLSKVRNEVVGSIYTTFNTYFNFNDKEVVNRPNTFLANMIAGGVVDKVIQIGYDGLKSPLVTDAELFDVDVVLFRSMT